MRITLATKIVGLLGYPVAHSFSPALHNHLYATLEIDMVYLAFDIEPTQVKAAVEGFRTLGFEGFNVTIPYKETVINMLDYVDEEARVIGAVNTVKIKNGELIGYNTDGQGFVHALKYNGFSVSGCNVTVLGAGGSARAICISLADENPNSITIVNRTFSRAVKLANLINDYKGKTLVAASRAIPHGADIIINTTSLGMWPNVKENPLDGTSLNPRTLVCDIVYNPLETAMLRYAASQGCKTCNGIGMLIGQGLRAVEIWMEKKLPASSWQVMMEALMFKNLTKNDN